jgi:hypothetical protein
MIQLKILKPKIPLLFVDTFFLINAIRDKHEAHKSHYSPEIEELINVVEEKTKSKKLLCPRGDQEEEYELGTNYGAEIRELQVRLSLGIRTFYHYGVYNLQIQKAIKAYVQNTNEVIYDQKCLFDRDVEKELDEALMQKYLVDAHFPTPDFMLTKRKEIKSNLSGEYERLRKEKTTTGITFDQSLKEEFKGEITSIKLALESIAKKMITKQPLVDWEINGLEVAKTYFGYYGHYANIDPKIEDIEKFMETDYYKEIPYISIHAKLFASMLTQPNSVKDTDNFDFDQTASMLPFCRFFLTDSNLKHRLTTKPLELDKHYDTKIFSMKEINSLIDELKAL